MKLPSIAVALAMTAPTVAAATEIKEAEAADSAAAESAAAESAVAESAAPQSEAPPPVDWRGTDPSGGQGDVSQAAPVSRAPESQEPEKRKKPPTSKSAVALGLHYSSAGGDVAEQLDVGGGFGVDLVVLGGPLHWPVMFGVQTGFETFGGPSGEFVLSGTQTGSYRINVNAYWGHALARLQPFDAWFSPFIELAGGFRYLDTQFESEDVLIVGTNDGSLGGHATGSLALGAGFDLSLELLVDFGFAYQFMLGGGATLPDPGSVLIDGNVIRVADVVSQNTSQHMFSFLIGFQEPGWREREELRERAAENQEAAESEE